MSLLDYLHAVSEGLGSGAYSTMWNCKQEYVMGLNIQSIENVWELGVFN